VSLEPGIPLAEFAASRMGMRVGSTHTAGYVFRRRTGRSAELSDVAQVSPEWMTAFKYTAARRIVFSVPVDVCQR